MYWLCCKSWSLSPLNFYKREEMSVVISSAVNVSKINVESESELTHIR